jgi:hypothetical protein
MTNNIQQIKLQDLEPLDLEKALPLVKLFLKLQKPLFIHGPVGVGKSDLIKQVALEGKRKVIDLRLSQLDISDLRGIPFLDSSKTTMNWAVPSCLPTDPEDDSILFLDEFNCATPSVQATAYQLVLDRKIGDYTLPAKVSVVAAGNRDSDRGVTFKMATPLLNRFVHIEIKYCSNAWLDWARKNNIHSAIIKFIEEEPKALFTLSKEPHTFKDRAFATPRSWASVDACLKELAPTEEALRDLALKDYSYGNNSPLLIEAVSSCISRNSAAAFINWIKYNLKDSKHISISKYLKMDIEEVLLLRDIKERELLFKTSTSIVESLSTYTKGAPSDSAAGLERLVKSYTILKLLSGDPELEVVFFSSVPEHCKHLLHAVKGKAVSFGYWQKESGTLLEDSLCDLFVTHVNNIKDRIQSLILHIKI